MIELYDHQKTALNLLRLNDGFALFMEQGTGKTFPVLFRLCELARTKRISSGLIIAPKAVCAGWYDKIEQLSDAQKQSLAKIDLKIVSYDLVWRRDEYKKARFDCVVFDESHYIKSPSAKRTKACLAIALKAKYRYALTGTPTSNGQLCNLWSQITAIDPVEPSRRGYPAYPGAFGGDSYYKWLDRVAYLDQWHKPYKYRRVDEIQDVLGELSYSIKKEDCLDLPEKLPDEILYIDLARDVKRLYKDMAKHSVILELDEGYDLLAPNPVTRLLHLRQLASGFVSDERKRIHEFSNPKITALKEFLSDFDSKVVIFCEFTHSIDKVSELLDSMKWKHVVLDGRSKDSSIWRKFQDDDSVRAIVVQSKSGSAGIDLYASDTCIFFEPPISSNIVEQARDRIHRPGQTNKCSYYFMLTSGTVEFAIYKALLNYQDFGEALFTRYLDEYTKGAKLDET